jgi:hypothetical protein
LIDGDQAFKTAIIESVRVNISEQADFVITSRIDNDDMIHKDFINTIQTLFQPVAGHVIDLRTGYQLIIEKRKHEILMFTDPFNPFISLIENPYNLKSAFQRITGSGRLRNRLLFIKEAGCGFP